MSALPEHALRNTPGKTAARASRTVHAGYLIAANMERAELRAEKLSSALISVMKAAVDRTEIGYVPRFLLAVPLNRAIRRPMGQSVPDREVFPCDLSTKVHYDAVTVMGYHGPTEAVRRARLSCSTSRRPQHGPAPSRHRDFADPYESAHEELLLRTLDATMQPA